MSQWVRGHALKKHGNLLNRLGECEVPLLSRGKLHKQSLFSTSFLSARSVKPKSKKYNISN